MKKKWSIIAACLLILICAIGLSACGGTTTFTVTFKNGDEILSSQSVEKGVAATAPTDKPIKASTAEFDYEFDGWDKAFDNVTEDITVNAVFRQTARKYIVTFMNGDEAFETQRVAYGKAADSPRDTPVKASTAEFQYVFDGWDKAFDNVTEDITVNAKFKETKRSYTVTFMIGYEPFDTQTVFATQKVIYGETAVSPQNTPTKPEAGGYEFVFTGWYYGGLLEDNENAEKFDFTTPITKDIMLYAHFDKQVSILTYTLSADKSSYIITGVNSANAATVTSINVYATHDKLPVTAIGNKAFSACKLLEQITIPEGVTTIGEDAFLNCGNLADITIPDSVTKIGLQAFSNTAWLTAQPDGVVYAGKVAYTYKGSMPDDETFITLRPGTKGIAQYAFKMSYLSGIDLGGTVEVIGAEAFASSDITAINLNGVKEIGDKVFSNCKRLTAIDIPDSVKTIGELVFNTCSRLASITIGAGLESIGSSFASCIALESITVDVKNQAYMSAGNCLISKDDKTLLAGCKTSVIPADGSVTAIGEAAFSGMNALTELSIPASIKSIGKLAFAGCNKLASFTLSEGLTTIGINAFNRCTALTSLTLPSTVTTIADYAFSYCTKLADLRFNGNTEQWKAVRKEGNWRQNCDLLTVVKCTNGDGSAW